VRPPRLAKLVGIFVAIAPVPGAARPRPLFEPSDLEMEKPGVLDIDLQFGAVRAEAWRLVVPDVEVDLGLSAAVELDIDAAYAIEGNDGQSFELDHPAPDNVWIAAKIGLADWRDEDRAAWAIGLQVGPKLPTARDARGIGGEGLLLAGRAWGENHLVLNLGGLVDPRGQDARERPVGAEAGLDAEIETGMPGLSVTGELGALHFFSRDEDQLHVTAGLTWSPSESLELSAVGLVGLLAGGDKLGVLIGVSPKFSLFK
jgi:hypothetical protein